MNTSLRVTRIPSHEVRAVTLARLDYDLAGGPLAQGASMDPRIVDPALEELVNAVVAEAESSARTRGYESGYREGRDRMVQEIRDQLERETAALREAQRLAHEQEHAQRLGEVREMRDTLQHLLDTFTQAIGSVESTVMPLYEEVGRELSGVVLALVEDILGRELGTEKPHVMGTIARALGEIPERSEVSIALHPADRALLEQMDIDLAQHLGRPVTLVEDLTIDRHGAVVMSGCTRVDAQIQASLDRLREALAS